MAIDKGATVGEFVRWLLEVLGAPQSQTIEIFVDNKGTLDISQNPVQPGRNLHVHARYFYIKDPVKWKVYSLHHLSTEDQVSDILCTFKTNDNFKRLYALAIGTAIVNVNEDGKARWDESRL